MSSARAPNIMPLDLGELLLPKLIYFMNRGSAYEIL